MTMSLRDDDVHVWRIALASDDAQAAALSEVLSESELAQAARFHQPLHRRRFLVRRAAYRRILADYTGLAAASLCWQHNRFGKPSLDIAGLAFNASHSHEVALLALTSGKSVGVDIEQIRSIDLPLNTLAVEEQLALKACALTARTRAFFLCWTRKEAYIKARGMGLSLPLSSFVMPIDSGTPLAWTDSEANWSLLRLDIAPGYEAALAVMGAPPRVTLRDWSVS